uniref:Uncharacterized protein n=1 Tax=Arundo donax TaxID=35708 RepID=A0A0A8ZI89_ARUDO
MCSYVAFLFKTNKLPTSFTIRGNCVLAPIFTFNCNFASIFSAL